MFAVPVVGIWKRQGERVAEHRFALLKCDAMLSGISDGFLGVPLKLHTLVSHHPLGIAVIRLHE
jgi:hypothetical protein